MQFARYGKLLTEAYDLDKPEAPAQELAYYLDWIRASREPVLEPMCGSGRFLVPLLEAGIDADGVDASPDMLASCRRRCQERGLAPMLVEQRLHELDLPRRYGVAFIPADSFGLILDRAEASAALDRLFRHLLPGGRLLFEIQRPLPAPGRQDRWTGRWWTRPDGAHIVLRTITHYGLEERVARSGRGGPPAVSPMRSPRVALRIGAIETRRAAAGVNPVLAIKRRLRPSCARVGDYRARDTGACDTTSR